MAGGPLKRLSRAGSKGGLGNLTRSNGTGSKLLVYGPWYDAQRQLCWDGFYEVRFPF